VSDLLPGLRDELVTATARRSGVLFHVHGTPTQQGSTKGWLNPKNGKVQVTHDNPAALRSWRQDVASQARDAGCAPLDGPMHVRATFRFLRPASVTPKKRPLPSVKPDLDKLLRSVLDALTGVAFKDDAQVVAVDVVKVYGAEPGLTCWVGPAVTAASTRPTNVDELPLEPERQPATPEATIAP